MRTARRDPQTKNCLREVVEERGDKEVIFVQENISFSRVEKAIMSFLIMSYLTFYHLCLSLLTPQNLDSLELGKAKTD